MRIEERSEHSKTEAQDVLNPWKPAKSDHFFDIERCHFFQFGSVQVHAHHTIEYVHLATYISTNGVASFSSLARCSIQHTATSQALLCSIIIIGSHSKTMEKDAAEVKKALATGALNERHPSPSEYP